MKRFLIIAACICFSSLSLWAQTNRSTRPRIAAAPTPLPQNNDANQNADNRAPVLKNSNNQANQANKQDDEVVGDDEVIKIETNLVTIPVSVLDRDGRFISGLQKQDFQIFENGVQQKIDSFASVEQPFTVVLLIDVSPSTQFQINEIQDAAIAFIDQLRPNDKVIVISFDETVHVLSPLTNNRAVLRNAVRRAEFGDGTSLYEAVDYVISQQLRRIEGRKAVVLFTDGVDTTSRRANYQSTVRDIEELDALFYPIRYDTMSDMAVGGNIYYPPQNSPQRRRGGGNQNGGSILGQILGGILNGGNVQIGGGNYPNRGGGGYPNGGASGSSRAEYETGNRYLEDLARNSGGRKFEATNNLDAAFSGIAEELRRQYSLGYYPETVGKAGERKQIKVRVKRPNLVVRSKNSYVVGR